MTISDKIRTTREEKKLSREYVAGRLGISLTAYGNIERGETDISVSRLEEIAQVLGKTLVELILKGEEGIFIMNTQSGANPVGNGSVIINFYGKEYDSIVRNINPTKDE